jgi:acetate kinase
LGLAVLVVNAGSSSLKLRLIGPDDELIGARDLPPQPPDLAAELTALGAPDAVGHRIVHGGERFREPFWSTQTSRPRCAS